MSRVAVLFARSDSIYKTMPSLDVYDEARNALTWKGGSPIVAHPPCRLWSRLRRLSTAPVEERDLALWAVWQVRRWGGVLEHPAGSQLFDCLAVPGGSLPASGERDVYGGFVVTVAQWWWGHKAEKWTGLYFCGVEPHALPPLPFRIGEASHVIAQSNRRQKTRLRPEVTKAEREHTPPAFAEWLVAAAKACKR
jgi:hypothetical protein